MNTTHRTTKIILCIDDNEAVLQYEQALLERSGYAVLTASSAQLGFALLSVRELDAVIVDYAMRGTNGYEIAVEMKRMRPELRIILLSGGEVPSHELASFDAFIPKLEASQELLPMIADLCSRTRPSPQPASVE